MEVTEHTETVGIADAPMEKIPAETVTEVKTESLSCQVVVVGAGAAKELATR